MTFLTETKCKIRFIYVRFNCKSVVKNVWKLCPLGGTGGPTLNRKIHLKFPFRLLEPFPYYHYTLSVLTKHNSGEAQDILPPVQAVDERVFLHLRNRRLLKHLVKLFTDLFLLIFDAARCN